MRSIKSMVSALKSFLTLVLLRLKGNTVSFSCRIISCKVTYPVALGSGNLISETTLSGNVRIFSSNKIYNSKLAGHNRLGDGNTLYNAVLGRYSYLGSGCTVSNATIGQFCSLGNNIMMAPGKHPLNLISTHPAFYSKHTNTSQSFSDKDYFKDLHPIEIGNDVWIGNSVTLVDGVKVHNGSVIAAGAVVTEDVQPYAIVGGVPAKLIRFRFSEETISLLLKSNWWDWPAEKLQSMSQHFRLDNEEEIRIFLKLNS